MPVCFGSRLGASNGYGFESCDANGPRNVKNRNFAEQRPVSFPHVGSKASALQVPKRRASPRCDSCDTETLRFVWPRCTRETDGIAAKLGRRAVCEI